MKMIRYSAYLLLIIFLTSSCGNGNNTTGKQKITISGAFALYPLTVKWAEEYMKENQNVQIDISAGGAGKGMTDVLSDMVDIAMVSREVEKVEVNKGAFAIAVAKDAVVPVFNTSNPLKQTILEQGVDSTMLSKIYIEGKINMWNDIIKVTSDPIDLHLYTRSDACGAASMWAKFLGKKQEDLMGTGVFGDPGVADAVKSDKFGFGYNNIIYVYDFHTRKKNDGMEVVPIDCNKNGHIDPEEKFYATIDELILAIKDGRYPSPPARDLYLVTKGKPANKAVVDFIKWILNKGQQYIEEAGYVNFPSEKINHELEKLK